MTRILLTSALLLALSACGGDPQGSSTTKLDAVEVQPGTISDSMIILDDAASDGTAVDNSVPGEESKGDGAKSEDESPAGKASEESADSENSEAVELPAGGAKKAATGDAPTKRGE